MAWIATRKWFRFAARPFWALAVVVVVEAILFVGHHSHRWHKALQPRRDVRLAAGEGLVIRCDGHGYYAWLRSLLIDGDCSFDNEFDRHNPVGDWVPAGRTERGLRANPWSVGPACIWSLTVVPAHLVLTALRDRDALPWPADGYALPYQLVVGSTTVLVSALGLVFLYAICRQYARPARAALAAALLTLGTGIVYYSAVEVTMAHGPATAALAGLVCYWLRTYGSARPGRWLLLGVLVGLAALMRWQLATYALLPAGECLLSCRRSYQGGAAFRRPIVLLGLAALGAMSGFLPQALAWNAVYGHWLVAPMVTAHNWLSPSWWQVLGSSDHGLIYWTPLTLLALAGLLALRTHRKTDNQSVLPSAADSTGRTDFKSVPHSEPALLLLAAFLLQLYVVASLLGGEMRVGVSFGMRFLTESMVALAPGLALLLDRASARWLPLLSGLGCLLVLWNLLLIAQLRYGLISAASGADPATLVCNSVQLVVRKKLLLTGSVLAGPALLWLLLGRPNRREATAGSAALCA
jgi:hypothetical protein